MIEPCIIRLLNDTAGVSRSPRESQLPANAALRARVTLLLFAVVAAALFVRSAPKSTSPEAQATLNHKVSSGPTTDLTRVRLPFAARALPEKTAGGAAHWAYQPMLDPTPPVLVAETADASWPRNELDHFILARLHESGLVPAHEADRRTLLRRASLDLIGVPPSVEDIEQFERDTRSDAYERRIDALLASPMYGERWGRHWLDVARYADSNGMDENVAFGNAFRYRDYVIDAFNRDTPFDEFLTEQLAGDLVAERANPTADDDARTRSRIAALGFLALGPKMLAEPDKEKERVDVVDEQIDVVSKAFLAQTISCARCHDHKFDPISHADYYAISGVFRSVSTFDSIATVGRVAQRPLATVAEIKEKERITKLWQDDAKRLDEVRDAARVDAARETTRANNALLFAFMQDSSAHAARHYMQRVFAQAHTIRPRHAALLAAIDTREKHNAAKPVAFPRALAVNESKVDETPIHDRGDHMQPTGDTIARAIPAVLERSLAGPAFPKGASGRLELAQWIADTDNPLTARVAVNRLWTWHFGVGLVDTPSNFGTLGGKPTHPELLDFLARRFTRDGWSMKSMHRFIMNSATYRQSSATHIALPSSDPENRLLSRFPRRRVEAEAIRDSVLATSGALDRTMYGTLLSSNDHDYVTNDQSGNTANYDATRRSIYLPVIRNAMFGMFTAFDYPDASAPIECRPRTVVAPQALFFLNSPMVEGAAKKLSEAVSATNHDAESRVREAFRRTLAREPDAAERDDSRAFLADLERSGVTPPDALTRLMHALLSTNEFVMIE